MSVGREREVDDRIADWVDGRLSDREHERFVAELRVNPQLRRDLEEYERTVAAVRAALQAPTEPVQLADRVLATIAAGRSAPTSGGAVLRWRPLLWSLATAAALLVVALLVDAWSAPAPEKSLYTAQNDRVRELQDALPGEAGAVEEKAPRAGLDELLANKDAGAWQQPADQEQQDRDAAALRVVVGGEGHAGKASTAAPAVVPGASVAPVGKPAGGRVAGEAGPTASPAPPGPTGPPDLPVRNEVAESRGKAGMDDKAPPPADPQALGAVTGQPEENLEAVTRSPAEPGAPAASAPVLTLEPVDPLPLVVVLGRAPAAEELFRLRARKEKAAGGAATATEAKAADDAGRRFDEFFTAQVAELAQVAAVAGTRSKKREAPRDRTPPEVPQPETSANWLLVADVRLRQLEQPAAGATAEAQPRDAATAWVERDWLVEGTRQDVASLLQRLASFTGAASLQLRTGETTDVPAAKAREQVDGAVADTLLRLPDATRQRIVLRFRLQAR